MTKLLRCMLLAAFVVSGCGDHAPDLPTATDTGRIHELLTGPGGAAFLNRLSTHRWPDGGARAATLFDWISREASSPDKSISTQAGEGAYALARYLGNSQAPLLDIGVGWFGLKHESVGELNPKLVQSYAAALTPFQSALACDPTVVPGFRWLEKNCQTALVQSRSVFVLLGTDAHAAAAFSDTAYSAMDEAVTKFARGLIDPSSRFDQGPEVAGTLLGLVQAGAHRSGLPVRTVQDEENRANYLTASTVLRGDANSGIPPKYFLNGRLMSPDEVGRRLSPHELAAYFASLALYLRKIDEAESHISTDLRHAYRTASGRS